MAEQRADEAEEEQLRTEQQLTAATSELQSARQTPQHAHHEAQAYQPAERNTQEELHAAHTRAHDLQMSLASAESMLNSTQRQLESANERLNQLEQSAYGPSVDGDRPGVDGQAYPNGVSQLPLGQKAGSGQLPSWVGADKDLSLSDDTAQLVQVTHCSPSTAPDCRITTYGALSRSNILACFKPCLTSLTCCYIGYSHGTSLISQIQAWLHSLGFTLGCHFCQY